MPGSVEYSRDLDITILNSVYQPMATDYQHSNILPIPIGKNPAQKGVLAKQIRYRNYVFSEIFRRLW